MTALSPPTDAETRAWRDDDSPIADAPAHELLYIIDRLCDALLDERAAHSATKAALDKLKGFAKVGLSYAHEQHPPHVGMFTGPCPQCLMMVDAERALACLSEPSPTQNVNENG